MKWLLIVWIINGFGGAVEQVRAIPFNTEAACRAALTEVRKTNIRGFCAPEGVRESEGRQ